MPLSSANLKTAPQRFSRKPEDLNEISVQYLKGVGPGRKKLFQALGVETVEDLLYLFPRRYDDRRKMTFISQLKIGESQTIAGEIMESDPGRRVWYTKKHVFKIRISDGTGEITAIWFNQPYMTQYFKAGDRLVLHGKIESYKDKLQIISPEYEIIEDEEEGAESLSIGRIVPVYPLTRGMRQRTVRRTVKYAVDHYLAHLKDVLPYSLRQKYKLLNLAKSLVNLHFPEEFELQKEAYRRISFEEFFVFQISVFLRRGSIVQKEGIAHKIPDKFLEKFGAAFPFALTAAQKRVLGEMAHDMQSPSPMHRLLQGDVGSGKTLVAFFGCLLAKENGYQSAFMAPTEILARQHFESLNEIISSHFKGFKTALLVSGLPKNEKEKIYEDVKKGKIHLLIGTHALIEEGLEFKNLSFVVMDEQHKFGVRQRALLPGKGKNPDTLIMTATPIPRTLCLTLYGDLDISVIDEMPPGRGKIKTLCFEDESAEEVYKMVREKIKKGEQAYIVYPIIEESETLDLKAAKAMFAHFKTHEFKDFNVGLIHGQMKKKESENTMDDFKNKKIDVLVATTVLEVGVDVPNANVMVIEHADRFGLSALHQLRGRIGRGASDALCLLIAAPTTEDAKARIDAILETTDGFKIAERDLLIRGPGQFFGRHQHGLNELKIANPVTQIEILQEARKEATEVIQADPKLEQDKNKELKSLIEKRYPTYLSMVRAG